MSKPTHNSRSLQFQLVGLALLLLVVLIVMAWAHIQARLQRPAALDGWEIVQYGAFGVAVVILALLIGIVLHASQRIRALAATAERIAAGELAVDTAIRGHDEVAILGTALDDMTRQLRAT